MKGEIMKADEIKKAILENPSLPLVFSVDSEVVGDDSGSWVAHGYSVQVTEYVIYDDGDMGRFYVKEDIDELIEQIAERQDKEDYEIAGIEARNMDWVKAIIIGVDI